VAVDDRVGGRGPGQGAGQAEAGQAGGAHPAGHGDGDLPAAPGGSVPPWEWLAVIAARLSAELRVERLGPVRVLVAVGVRDLVAVVRQPASLRRRRRSRPV
jgi:hypothetical protein